MPEKRLNQIIAELPFEKKLLASGAVFMVISLFLPWYQDLDSFHTGDTFTGLTGPLYMVGLTFLIMSSLTLLFLVADEIGLHLPLAGMRSSKLYLGMGIVSFYLLFLANSVFFDHNFGVNITMKQSGFGMFLAFLAAAATTIGGYLSTRQRSTAWKEFEAETRPQASIKESAPVREPLMREPMMRPAMKMPPITQQKPKENLRTVHPELEKPTVPQMAPKAETPVGDSSNHNIHQNASKEQDIEPQPYRMDL